MAPPKHVDAPAPPRRTLAAGIAIGALTGAVIGVIAALTLVFVLSAVQITEPMAIKAMLFLGFEAAFGGAVVGGAIAALKRKRNTL
jgi:hypothetical protein